ncbi:uncharacterized protein EV420DRAFT_1199266 [Desarmillaria tabescens]|uniref:Uncharacterized protein n=1 Tax=Armillaria tabescens TaxID=1929756 RepID=A0AA39NBJ0_ARMTA|nr:uncharacterized protein EV420DRAFT_1199266 [Desarmillaria tabescens]KAK0462616.1 hypothetical protein EV420DRAFT_1199266 [Desarmillaria tabescens]
MSHERVQSEVRLQNDTDDTTYTVGLFAYPFVYSFTVCLFPLSCTYITIRFLTYVHIVALFPHTFFISSCVRSSHPLISLHCLSLCCMYHRDDQEKKMKAASLCSVRLYGPSSHEVRSDHRPSTRRAGLSGMQVRLEQCCMSSESCARLRICTSYITPQQRSGLRKRHKYLCCAFRDEM